MRVERLSILPYCEDRKMVRTIRTLLKHFVAHIAFVFPALFRQTLEQDFSFFPALWRNVNVRHDSDDFTFRRHLPKVDCEALMDTLIVGTVVNRLECGAKLGGMLGSFMGLKRRLILPHFNDHETV